MGIGLVLIIAPEHEATTRDRLAEHAMEAYRLGTIGSADGAPHVVLQ
ncbi:MAG: hypothetical protein M3347_17945 [Armatimonadota bacterium]|nr:hypothetical protein [Armatimonadota bacterium]